MVESYENGTRSIHYCYELGVEDKVLEGFHNFCEWNLGGSIVQDGSYRGCHQLARKFAWKIYGRMFG
jgi:hypothetical protein